MKTIRNIAIAFVILLIWGGVAFRLGVRSVVKNIETRVDTVVVRDTVRETNFVPVKQYVVRTEFIRDTIEIPIEQKVYQTEDYRAVVEGFRPALVEMELYRQTQLITKTIVPKPKRWGLGVQLGYGAGISKGKVVGVPYLGVGVSYNLIEW